MKIILFLSVMIFTIVFMEPYASFYREEEIVVLKAD